MGIDVFFYLFKERAEDTLCVPYLAACSGMWELSTFFSPGFVFIALIQEARPVGPHSCCLKKR